MATGVKEPTSELFYTIYINKKGKKTKENVFKQMRKAWIEKKMCRCGWWVCINDLLFERIDINKIGNYLETPEIITKLRSGKLDENEKFLQVFALE